MIIPVLLSGGVGSRLWPLSRELHPKQFQALAGDDSLLAQTWLRAAALPSVSNPIVVCNDEHRFMVAEQLRASDCQPEAILLEPEGKNTAPAVAVAALQAMKTDPEAVLLVMPADHVIKQVEQFAAAVTSGLAAAEAGGLVTFGIVPESPETGYGYIKAGNEKSEGCFAIEAFVEKPQLEVAEQYVADGNYYWNSGMFLLKAQTYIDELKTFAPEMVLCVEKALAAASEDLDFIRLEKEAFSQCPSDSIDYAVMEKTERGIVVPLSCGWSDVGAWSSLWEVNEKDSAGNVSNGDVIAHQSSNNYLHSNSRLVAALGVENLVVVETADAVLVADKDQVQNVKTIVSELKSQGRNEASVHTKVLRPWGSYESIAIAERFQVKRIIVNPGQQLSLQMHHHRAEHWIVVKGTAEVTRGEDCFIVSENESTYIPLGMKHRLVNPGAIPLELIEIQSGSYLGEDDIVRFEDVYGR